MRQEMACNWFRLISHFLLRLEAYLHFSIFSVFYRSTCTFSEAMSQIISIHHRDNFMMLLRTVITIRPRRSNRVLNARVDEWHVIIHCYIILVPDVLCYKHAPPDISCCTAVRCDVIKGCLLIPNNTGS